MRRLVIVSTAPQEAPSGYKGMDRVPLGGCDGIPEEIVLRTVELEALGAEAGLPGLLNVLAMLRADSTSDYDLVWLGERPPAGWNLLGFDVGETTPARWSAIARWPAFLGPVEAMEWLGRLNAYGLFAQREDAQSYLERFLASDDPDLGWTSDGWVDDPDWYAVVAVWRLPDERG